VLAVHPGVSRFPQYGPGLAACLSAGGTPGGGPGWRVCRSLVCLLGWARLVVLQARVSLV